MKTVALALLLTAGAVCDAANFLRSGQVSEAEAEQSLTAELTSPENTERLLVLEESLRVTYASLPKNLHGNLGHQAVRYVLHRLFVQRYGWFIRGLEPNSDMPAPHEDSSQEWVPSYLQSQLEKRVGERGANLRELAALAAALEDLVKREAVERVGVAFDLHQLPKDGAVPKDRVEDALNTFYISFLMSGNFSAESEQELAVKKDIFSTKYSGYSEASQWLSTIEKRRLTKPEHSFADASEVATEVGEKYYQFNDLECRSLKETLTGMESKKAGRVRLSAFYKKALYSHWRFTEQADYLRTLGALDESDPRQPQVIVPNYIMARPNCLEASHFYAICCQNECEALMGTLEKKIGAPMAEPRRIAEIVANLPSDTVTAPRNLSAALLKRLDQVAAANYGGKVPLHGRLFAQWMHHAYPRECPYPHEAGLTSPQTPDEWMRSTGRTASQATAEEMQKQVDSDTCSSTAPCPDDEEEAELPWSGAEELLVSHEPEPVATAAPVRQLSQAQVEEIKVPQVAPKTSFVEVAVAGLLALAFAALLAVDYWRTLKSQGKWTEAGTKPAVSWRAALGFCTLTLAARAVDLVDGAAFGCALCGGSMVLAARSFADRLLTRRRPGTLPMHTKRP